jgi:hypothetical protein
MSWRSRNTRSSSWRFGEELEVQDMEALKQKFQKLEVQEPELWGEGIKGIIVGCLGALGGWRR